MPITFVHVLKLARFELYDDDEKPVTKYSPPLGQELMLLQVICEAAATVAQCVESPYSLSATVTQPWRHPSTAAL